MKEILTYGVRGRFRRAAGRILQSISRSNAMNGIGKKTKLVYQKPLWMTIRTALNVLVFALGALLAWIAFVQWRRLVLLKGKLAKKKREMTRRRRR